MGLLNQGTVFTQEWVDGLKAIPAQFMPCSIQIAEEAETPLWDEQTRTYIVNRPVLYSGPARVTPRRGALQQPLRENPTIIQHVQFQIPIDEYDFDLRNNCLVLVQSSPLNPRLLNYAYRVNELVDSGNPIEYTFWCIVDQEVRLNG